MGDLTQHFSRKEFACKGDNCCDGSAPISKMLVFIAEEIRLAVGASMTPTCGYRCLVHNREVGSKDTSQHPIGNAADFPAPKGYTLDEFYQVCDHVLRDNLSNGGGCAIYKDRGIVHIDVRDRLCWRESISG